MVVPIEEPQEEEIQEEEVKIIATSKPKDKPKFDFSVVDTDRPGLLVYTVRTKPAGEEWKILTILAPRYGAALELAGIRKDATVMVSEVPFEG